MTMSDPLGDMLTRIRNGQRARSSSVISPASQVRANVLEVLRREGYIRGFSETQHGATQAVLQIELKYHEGEAAIRKIERVESDVEFPPTAVSLSAEMLTRLAATASAIATTSSMK